MHRSVSIRPSQISFDNKNFSIFEQQYWYAHQTMRIEWGNCLSASFLITNGVRQGGVLSPYVFAIYIDDLSVELNKLQAGCCIGNNLINHILFADDLCCFSASLDGLQSIVDICSKFALENDLVFNKLQKILWCYVFAS